MVYFGHIKNGKVELDEAAPPPDGTRVRVEVVEASKPSVDPANDPAYHLADLAVDCGPDDFAAEHDHYIYGTPKRGKPQP